MEERIKLLRKELKLTQEQFGERLGISNTAVSKLEKGQNNVSEQNIIAIIREFNVNEEWLRFGTGKMFLDLSEDEFVKAAALLSNDSFARSLIIEYWKLDEESKSLFKNFIHRLSDALRGQD